MATGEDCNNTVAQFVKKQLRLLEMERQAEITEVDSLLATHSPKELERLGLCIRNLRVASVSTGMGGRRLIKLVRAEREGAPLPPTRLGPGDIVSVKTPVAASATVSSSSSSSSPARSSSAEHQQAQLSGVVVKIREGSLTIASDADRDDGSDTLILTVSEGDTGLIVTQMGNDVTYKRMKEALALISSGCAGLNRMQHAILGLAPVHGPSSAPISSPGEEKALHKAGSDRSSLNAQQQEAVEFALRTEDVALIHGPPGTGKTTTVAELVRRLVVEHGRRVLVCAPSNVAVDNIGEKLAPLIVPHTNPQNMCVYVFSFTLLLLFFVLCYMCVCVCVCVHCNAVPPFFRVIGWFASDTLRGSFRVFRR